MINRIMLIIIFSLTLIGCREDVNEVDGVALSINDLKIMRTNYSEEVMFHTLITNVYSEEFKLNVSDTLDLYYYKGKLKQVSQIRNNKRLNGIHFEFNSNGKLYFAGEYIDGSAEGIFRSYDTLGKIREISVYINGNEIIEYSGQELDSIDINPKWKEYN